MKLCTHKTVTDLIRKQSWVFTSIEIIWAYSVLDFFGQNLGYWIFFWHQHFYYRNRKSFGSAFSDLAQNTAAFSSCWQSTSANSFGGNLKVYESTSPIITILLNLQTCMLSGITFRSSRGISNLCWLFDEIVVYLWTAGTTNPLQLPVWVCFPSLDWICDVGYELISAYLCRSRQIPD